MQIITGEDVELSLDFAELADALDVGFKNDIVTPDRIHLPYGENNLLLLMPSWTDSGFLGVKIITLHPKNAELRKPTIQGAFMLFNSETGEPMAQIDAQALTNWRTAATSLLAARYLASPKRKKMLLLGTGNLAPYLVRAHTSLHDYDHIGIWGRNPDKAFSLSNNLKKYQIETSVRTDLKEAVCEADLITTATMSLAPLINGAWLKKGCHLDLVGSYKLEMREADDEAVRRSSVFIDTLHAIEETGDLATPLSTGVITKEDISGTLSDLCRKVIRGRIFDDEITLFKSVGHASEDLIAAGLVYRKKIEGNG